MVCMLDRLMVCMLDVSLVCLLDRWLFCLLGVPLEREKLVKEL